MAAQKDSTITYRPELAGAVREFAAVDNIRTMFIGEKVLPFSTVEEVTGQYPLISKENFRKAAETKRAPGGAFPRGDW
ncbi:MAG TPA: hypothetical protein VM431_11810, partial [Phycisphaerae bacterium]|nr:hypothetical protein [Phycisphaerae bacterium]